MHAGFTAEWTGVSAIENLIFRHETTTVINDIVRGQTAVCEIKES